MSKIIEWSEEQKKDWDAWVETRPAVVKELCRRFAPDRLYKIKSSGHRVTVYSFSEDGTITVNVTGEYNAVIFDRRVFGISPDDLEECELPSDNDSIGTILTNELEVDKFLDVTRPAILAKRN